MKPRVFAPIILLFALICVSGPAISSQTDWNKASSITFKDAVEVPKMVLPAGTYVFKLLDDDANHHIVEIWNGSQTKLLTSTIATTRVLLANAPAESSILFQDQGKGKPQAIKVWFHPGTPYGEEFVYPAKKK